MNRGSFDPFAATIIARTDSLKQALDDIGAEAGRLVMHEQRAWESVSFSGTRHRLVYEFTGAEAVEWGETLLSVLPEHEFAIPGQLVADATIVEVDHRMTDPPRLEVTLELLLLDKG